MLLISNLFNPESDDLFHRMIIHNPAVLALPDEFGMDMNNLHVYTFSLYNPDLMIFFLG